MVSSSRSNRLHSLDGLRGLAAVIVVVHHSLLVLPSLAAPYYSRRPVGNPGEAAWWLIYSPLHLAWEGTAAVYVFFVLSGFVLTLPVLRAADYCWRAYFPARLVRLMLPVAAAVAFVALTIVVVPRTGEGPLSQWLGNRVPYTAFDQVLRDLLLVFGTSGTVSPIWSLRWEILFSLLLPAYVAIARSFRKAWWVLPTAAILISGFGAYYGEDATRFLSMFAIGVWAAVERDRLTDWTFALARSRWGGLTRVALLAAAALLLSTRWMLALLSFEKWVGAIGVACNVIGAALLLFCALPGGIASRPLEARPLQFFGRVSFSLYLVHEPIVVAIALLLPPELRKLVMPLTLVVATVVAVLFYRFVELPAQRLSTGIRRRLSDSPPAVGPPSGPTGAASLDGLSPGETPREPTNLATAGTIPMATLTFTEHHWGHPPVQPGTPDPERRATSSGSTSAPHTSPHSISPPFSR